MKVAEQLYECICKEHTQYKIKRISNRFQILSKLWEEIKKMTAQTQTSFQSEQEQLLLQV